MNRGKMGLQSHLVSIHFFLPDLGSSCKELLFMLKYIGQAKSVCLKNPETILKEAQIISS